jgi:hypothetical protein
MAIQQGPQFDQAGDCDLGATRRNRRAGGAVAHPFRDRAGQTRPHFDVEDLTPGTSMPAVQANALTAKRMPGVRDHDKLRSVC